MSLASEIAEQPRVVRRLLEEGWPDAKALGRALGRIEHVTLVARGSSDNAATYGKYLFESVAAIVTALAPLAGGTAGAGGRSALSLAGLPEAVDEAVAVSSDAARLARRIGRADAIVVLGRGYQFAAALEASLKIKELARVWAEPYSSADFAHGPQTLLRRGTPVLLLSSRGATEAEARALARALARKGARLYAIPNDEPLAADVADAVLLRAPLSETLTPVSFVIAAQLLAVALARRRGRDPERPAGLSKVTRTC